MAREVNKMVAADVSNADVEIASGDRFAFGANWLQFLENISEDNIGMAQEEIARFLKRADLTGMQFLDIGSGSGLSSLAARRLGAVVTSFDYDPQSVASTREMKRRFSPEDAHWTIASGSVLDRDFVESLGKFDIAYSWGVLHHTGEMWKAVEIAAETVKPGGLFCLALYNDQGGTSIWWKRIKRMYCASPKPVKGVILGLCGLRLRGVTIMKDIFRGRPLDTILSRRSRRGMSTWRDLVDWVGGYPFEVAKPEEVLATLLPRGFRLVNLTTCGGGKGCNEYLFARDDQ